MLVKSRHYSLPQDGQLVKRWVEQSCSCPCADWKTSGHRPWVHILLFSMAFLFVCLTSCRCGDSILGMSSRAPGLPSLTSRAILFLVCSNSKFSLSSFLSRALFYFLYQETLMTHGEERQTRVQILIIKNLFLDTKKGSVFNIV